MPSWNELQAEADNYTFSSLGIGPDEPHLCDTCGRWLPCRHCTKDEE